MNENKVSSINEHVVTTHLLSQSLRLRISHNISQWYFHMGVIVLCLKKYSQISGKSVA